ncbi:pitrilysin family protein [Kamptonema cortianum]|nr:pitrilysin family protein [Kamptonema cortianum]MDL5050050.1 pitrilysin family protein [Oscillatoria amoena NRMC-F 0135]
MTKFQIFNSKSGGRLIVRDMPPMETVSIGIWAGIGSRYETAESAGISHFLEHMLFKGTRKRNALGITREVEGVGGYLNAFTSEENTCYYARVASTQFARVADVLCDMYQDSALDPSEIERERGVILEELAMVQDQPSQKVQENFNSLLWPNHPLGSPIAGTVKTVSGFSRRQLLSHYRSNYCRSNTVVSIAGKIDRDMIESITQPFFSCLPSGKKGRCRPWKTVKRRAPVFHYETRDVEQINAVLGFQGLSRRHPLRYAAKILNIILGENMSSRLFQVIREKHGLAYSIGSSQSLFSDTGAFTIFAGLPPEKYENALMLICRELQRVCDRTVTARELAEAKDYAIGMMTMSLESTTDQMIWGAESCLAYGRVLEADEIRTALKSVTTQQVMETARLLFRRENAALAVVGPEMRKKPFAGNIIPLN